MTEAVGESFPCYYTFKVFGRQSDTFVATVQRIIGATLGQVGMDNTKVRESAQGRYLSVTVVSRVETRAQLEQVYADLHREGEVLLYI